MKTLKLTALAAIAMIATGCASTNSAGAVDNASQYEALRADIAEVKQIAIQASENANIARRLSEENSNKINKVFRKSLRK